MRIALVLLLTFIVAFSDRPAAAQGGASGPRIALVIGNGNYPDSDTPLKEPVADARRLAEELRRSSTPFDVEVGENLTKAAMHSALERLNAKIKPGSVVMVFFGGYAIQSNRQSYLIPVDGQIWTEADVRRDGFSVDKILNDMNARGARVKIAVLDAARRNPFERRFRPVAMGLAPVVAPTDALVMYSASLGLTVSDAGNDSRLFVTELLNHLKASGLTGEEVFNRTRMDVARNSQGRQVPWFSSSLISDFSFSDRQQARVEPAPQARPAPPPPPPAAPQPRVTAPEPRVTAPEPRVTAPEPRVTAPEPRVTAPEPRVTAPEPRVTAPEPKAPEPKVAARPETPPAPPPPPPPPKRADDPAIQELTKRIQANPSDAAALYRRGQLNARNGDYESAAYDFGEAIRLNPNDVEALNNRCWVRAVLNDLQAALRDCDAALQIRPRFVDALDSRGFVRLKSGNSQNAIEDYDAALKINSNQASSLYGRGIAKLRSGNSLGGNSDIAAAKAINPRIAEEFAIYGIK